jgi:hypothetical protein
MVILLVAGFSAITGLFDDLRGNDRKSELLREIDSHLVVTDRD